MPNQPKTPTRAIRIEDGLWHAVQQKARQRQETVSEVIRRSLRDYLTD